MLVSWLMCLDMICGLDVNVLMWVWVLVVVVCLRIFVFLWFVLVNWELIRC